MSQQAGKFRELSPGVHYFGRDLVSQKLRRKMCFLPSFPEHATVGARVIQLGADDKWNFDLQNFCLGFGAALGKVSEQVFEVLFGSFRIPSRVLESPFSSSIRQIRHVGIVGFRIYSTSSHSHDFS